jgi:hypothetical protein
LIAVDATWDGETHGVYAMIDAATEAALTELGPVATEMVEGARFPVGVGQ